MKTHDRIRPFPFPEDTIDIMVSNAISSAMEARLEIHSGRYRIFDESDCPALDELANAFNGTRRLRGTACQLEQCVGSLLLPPLDEVHDLNFQRADHASSGEGVLRPLWSRVAPGSFARGPVLRL